MRKKVQFFETLLVPQYLSLQKYQVLKMMFTPPTQRKVLMLLLPVLFHLKELASGKGRPILKHSV